MTKIKITAIGQSGKVLRDVTVGKEYEILRVLKAGDLTAYGSAVPEGQDGVEFLDDVGDVVAYRLGYLETKYEIIEDSKTPDLGSIIITEEGGNMAFGDTTLGKEYKITQRLQAGDINSYGSVVGMGDDGVEFIDDVGDVVSYVFNYQGAKHILTGPAA